MFEGVLTSLTFIYLTHMAISKLCGSRAEIYVTNCHR